jgi:antitoxin PrlF
MTKYLGTITTTGNSKAIRLDASLFKSHGEFRGNAKVQASIIGRGQMLISVVDDAIADDVEDDPALRAFLAFLERDIINHPERLIRPSSTRTAEAIELVAGVQSSNEDELPDDVTI